MPYFEHRSEECRVTVYISRDINRPIHLSIRQAGISPGTSDSWQHGSHNVRLHTSSASGCRHYSSFTAEDKNVPAGGRSDGIGCVSGLNICLFTIYLRVSGKLVKLYVLYTVLFKRQKYILSDCHYFCLKM